MSNRDVDKKLNLLQTSLRPPPSSMEPLNLCGSAGRSDTACSFLFFVFFLLVSSYFLSLRWGDEYSKLPSNKLEKMMVFQSLTLVKRIRNSLCQKYRHWERLGYFTMFKTSQSVEKKVSLLAFCLNVASSLNNMSAFLIAQWHCAAQTLSFASGLFVKVWNC